MSQSLYASITFSYMEGIGPATFINLLKHFQSVERAYMADSTSLIQLLGKSLAEKFILFKRSFDIQKEIEMFKKNNITVVTREDSFFPKQLLEISDPPICLYVKGDITKYDFESDVYISIVGTRKPTMYGEQVTRKFAYELAQQGLVIVSGLALGVDAVAHTAALDADGRTIAFLGCGVNIMYPSANRFLFKRIIDNNGLIISEFPPNMQAQPGLFVQRNRLISGLSKGILVAEGLKDSGSLITARYAAQQGKDVFAPPGPITSELSEAPNLLLKEGAKLVTKSDDILEEYSLTSKKINENINVDSLSKEEQLIYALLLKEPYDSDDIARAINIPIFKTLTILSGLEIQGIIVKKGGLYTIY